MNRKTYWGIVALIIVLIAAGGFMYWQWSTVQQLKEQLAEDEPMLEEMEKPVAENKPPVAREGFKMVPHGDHWHEVPMDAPDVWQEAPPEPSAQPVVTYTGPLTYHQELLKTNPVEALRLQSEERGHINAKWIPPFPPDDVEAQEYAKAMYHHIYNRDNDNPIYVEGLVNTVYESERFKEKYGVLSARCSDLSKISWINLSFPMSHYHGSNMGKFNGWAQFQSDYFPDHISKMK